MTRKAIDNAITLIGLTAIAILFARNARRQKA